MAVAVAPSLSASPNDPADWCLALAGGWRQGRPTPLQTHDSARAVATTCTHTNASLHNPISLGAALTAEEPPERNVVMRHVSSGRGLTKYERGVDEVKAIMMAG